MTAAQHDFTPRELRLYATGKFHRLAEDRREALRRAVAEDEEIAAKVDFFRLLMGCAASPGKQQFYNEAGREALGMETSQDRADPQAVQTFVQLFGIRLTQSQMLSVSCGASYETPTTAAPPHPENFLACNAFLQSLMLAFGFSKKRVTYLPKLTANLSDNMVFFGGANSTPHSSVALELEGPVGHLRRPEDRGKQPIIPLPFYGLTDPEHLEEEVHRQGRRPLVYHTMPNGDHAVSHNWPVRCVDDDSWLWPEAEGKQKWFPEHKCSIPALTSDFLIAVRMPNILSPDFEKYLRADPSTWPFLLIFDGMHGTATRAVELLANADATDVLSASIDAVESQSAFLLLYRAHAIEFDGTCHRARKIELVKGFPLTLDAETYRTAHRHAKHQLESLQRPCSSDFQVNLDSQTGVQIIGAARMIKAY